MSEAKQGEAVILWKLPAGADDLALHVLEASDLPDGEELVGFYVETTRGRRPLDFTGGWIKYGPLEKT